MRLHSLLTRASNSRQFAFLRERKKRFKSRERASSKRFARRSKSNFNPSQTSGGSVQIKSCNMVRKCGQRGDSNSWSLLNVLALLSFTQEKITWSLTVLWLDELIHETKMCVELKINFHNSISEFSIESWVAVWTRTTWDSSNKRRCRISKMCCRTPRVGETWACRRFLNGLKEFIDF